MTKILITGISGFVGSTISIELLKYGENIDIIGIDNLSRYGSEKISLNSLTNRLKSTEEILDVYLTSMHCLKQIG